MAKKLKYKPYAGTSGGFYRLHMTESEAELISVLVRNVRLGNDEYQQAAMNLIEMFNQNENFDYDILSDYIHFDVTPETESQCPTIEVYTKSEIAGDQFRIEGGQWPFPVYEQESGCSGNCPGCSCAPSLDEPDYE